MMMPPPGPRCPTAQLCRFMHATTGVVVVVDGAVVVVGRIDVVVVDVVVVDVVVVDVVVVDEVVVVGGSVEVVVDVVVVGLAT